jgi:DNA helicase TIP49 (TBP-interacting protein)
VCYSLTEVLIALDASVGVTTFALGINKELRAEVPAMAAVGVADFS